MARTSRACAEAYIVTPHKVSLQIDAATAEKSRLWTETNWQAALDGLSVNGKQFEVSRFEEVVPENWDYLFLLSGQQLHNHASVKSANRMSCGVPPCLGAA